MPVPRPIVLFDGECGLCDRSVRFLLRHDRQGVFHYAPLRSGPGKQAMQEVGEEPADLTTVVLIDEQGVHKHSDAVWRIARRLPWPWRIGAWMRFIPRPLRNAGYGFVSRHRTQWFGTADVCEMTHDLSPDKRQRILV